MDQSTIAQMRPVLMAIAFRVCKCRLDEFKAAKPTQTGSIISGPTFQAQTMQSFKVTFGFYDTFLCDTFGSAGEIICSNSTNR